MVMYIPQRGPSGFYSLEEIGQQEAGSEVELQRVPSKEDLGKLPKTVLLKIAIELDPGVVAEKFKEGWTKEDILRLITQHVSSAVGNRRIEGWPLIAGIQKVEFEIEKE